MSYKKIKHVLNLKVCQIFRHDMTHRPMWIIYELWLCEPLAVGATSQ